MKNHFKVLGIREEKELQAWLENQIGIRKAKVHTNEGFESYVVSFTGLEKFKSLEQNRTFWALVDAFWQSGCSSFISYEALVERYYKIAGLITIKTKSILNDLTRAVLYKGVKALPITFTEKQKVYQMLRGEYEKWESWSRVKKEKATLTISTLMHDMDSAGVNTKKYEEILKGMNKY